MANTRTVRKCPWCGTGVRLAHAPIVATNVEGAPNEGEIGGAIGGLGGGEFFLDDAFTIGADDDHDGSNGSDHEDGDGFGERSRGAVPEPETARSVPASGAAVLGYAGDLPIVANSPLPAGSEGGLFQRMRPKQLPAVLDVADARDLPARACTACHRPLPLDIDDRDVLILAVLGINRAGKTYLLATALTEILQNGALDAAGITGVSADEHTANRFHRDYYLPVFRRRSRLDPTQDLSEGDTAEPMIFRLEVDGRPYLLALHDLAGEAIAEPQRRAVVAPFIRRADGVVFVVDPLEIEDVRSQLPFEHITVDWRGWSQVDVLRGCVETLHLPEQTPVSVVITKSDLIGTIDRKMYRFATPSPATGWLEDQYAVDREVRDLLRAWGAGSFEDAAAGAGRGFFHAVTAFGQAPETPSAAPVVRPVRVADPFGTLIRLISEARTAP